MKVKTNKRPCTRLLFAATTAAVLLFSCNTSDDWSDDHLASASAAYISAVDATYAAAAGSTTTDVSMKVSLSGDTLAKGFAAGTTVYNPSDSNVEPNLVVITVKNNAGSLV